MTAKALSERAKHRLRIAAMLLRASGHELNGPRETFYEDMRIYLAALAPEVQTTLRSHVDWVEDYDNAPSAVELHGARKAPR